MVNNISLLLILSFINLNINHFICLLYASSSYSSSFFLVNLIKDGCYDTARL